MENIVATTKLQETFDMASTHMILADAKLSAKDANAMMDEIETVDGVKYAIGFNSLVGSAVPEEVLPESLTSLLKSDKYQLSWSVPGTKWRPTRSTGRWTISTPY